VLPSLMVGVAPSAQSTPCAKSWQKNTQDWNAR